MTVDEGNEAGVELIVNCTVPVLCPENHRGVCELELELVTLPEKDVINRCRGTTPKNPVALKATSCGMTIRGIKGLKDFDRRWEDIKRQSAKPLLVTGTIDGTYDHTRTMKILMRAATFLTHRVWSNYRLSPITVSINNNN